MTLRAKSPPAPTRRAQTPIVKERALGVVEDPLDSSESEPNEAKDRLGHVGHTPPRKAPVESEKDGGITSAPPSSAPGRPVDAPKPIVPQAGFQRAFLSSPADVVIGGGVAGAGKSYALLMEPLRNVMHPEFGAVIFRRTYAEITKEGGLWDESKKIYPRCGGVPKGETDWTFPDKERRPGRGGRVTFAHLQHEQDKESWKGAQLPYVGFDQLETFTEGMFWYLWSRNRSTSGIRPYIQCTCNPVPDDDPTGGWLRRLIDWWIGADGLAIPERGGVVRWFLRINEVLEWSSVTWSSRSSEPYDAAARSATVEFTARYPPSPGDEPHRPQSLTFIPGKLEDNPALTKADPGYGARLDALPYVDRMRLRHGNWNTRVESGNVFNRAWFEIVDVVPRDARRGRGWDKGGTAGGGDPSAGVKLAEWRGIWYVEHVVEGQWSSGRRDDVIDQTAEFDGPGVVTVIEQEPGSGGKQSAEISVARLAGREVHVVRVTGSKLTRAKPFASQAEHGNVKVLRGPWAQKYIEELHRFTGVEGGTDNQVDASSVIFNHMTLHGGGLQLYGVSPSRPSSDDSISYEVAHEERLKRFLSGG